MTTPTHPGKVVYLDGNTNKVTTTLDVSQVPEGLRFVDTDKGKVPVVKVVAFTSGNQRIIKEYGPNDAMLRSTVQMDTTPPRP